MTKKKAGASTEKAPRPVRLFRPPEPIEAMFVVPDDPPFRFTWRRRSHAVARADGPERIAEEWWQPDATGAAAAVRDYYRVEDAEGRRFWLFRAGLGEQPHWFLHGVFA
jgi:protein ImuB